MKAQLAKMNMDLIESTFENAAKGVNGGIERYGKMPGFSGVIDIDNNYEEIYKQNKELDKRYQDVIKLVKEIGIPAKEMPDLYKGILEFYAKQNQGLMKLSTSGAAQTKQAKKTQKFVSDLMEKYINEMTKAMEEME